jgi:hypothetical protein
MSILCTIHIFPFDTPLLLLQNPRQNILQLFEFDIVIIDYNKRNMATNPNKIYT